MFLAGYPGNRGSILGRCKGFSPFRTSKPAMGPTSPLSSSASRGVKRPVREADSSPTSNAEVKNGGAVYQLTVSLRRVEIN
jgi:hypothetical protein